MLRTIYSLVALSVVLTGCASGALSSRASLTKQDRQVGNADGEVYFLPRAVVKAHVRVSPTSGISVILDQATLVSANTSRWNTNLPAGKCEWSDPGRGPFVLSHRVTGFHVDDITVETTDGLLKTVNAKTEEQTAEIATALAKAAATRMGLEAAVTSAEVEVLAIQFDPADCEDVAATNRAIAEAIKGPALTQLRIFQEAQDKDGPLKGLVLKDITPAQFRIDIKNFEPFRFPEDARPKVTDCRKGICVPVVVPMVISVQTGDIVVDSQPFTVPNRSDPAVIPVARSAFADVDTKLTLSSGVLTKRQVIRGSEVVTILTIPATIINAYLTEVASVFTKRKSAFDNENAFRAAVEAEAAKSQAKAKAEAAIIAEGSKPLVKTGISGLSATRVSAPSLAPLNNGGATTTESNDGQVH